MIVQFISDNSKIKQNTMFLMEPALSEKKKEAKDLFHELLFFAKINKMLPWSKEPLQAIVRYDLICLYMCLFFLNVVYLYTVYTVIL